jgi:hypothetical protein
MAFVIKHRTSNTTECKSKAGPSFQHAGVVGFSRKAVMIEAGVRAETGSSRYASKSAANRRRSSQFDRFLKRGGDHFKSRSTLGFRSCGEIGSCSRISSRYRRAMPPETAAGR